MSGEKDLDQLKKEAAAKAKAEVLSKIKTDASVERTEDSAKHKIADAGGDSPTDEKAKAAAAAKAKAAVAAKAEVAAGSVDDSEDKTKAAAAAKAKAAAAAKAKAAAAAKAKVAAGSADDSDKAKAAAAAKAKAAAAAKARAAVGTGGAADDEKAKAIAAAKAKAAAAAKAKAAGTSSARAAVAEEEEKPSPNQPYLDKYVKVIGDHLGQDVLEESYINRLSKDVPTLVVKKESYYKTAEFLKYNEQLGFDYLSEIHGTDFQTHMEVYAHLYSYKNHQSVALKVKIDRDQPVIDSLVQLWPGADWPECEAYDLLGIQFNGHPNLHRIMMGEDWVGHPLRKDYDVEV